jgi:hypothetical protein
MRRDHHTILAVLGSNRMEDLAVPTRVHGSRRRGNGHRAAVYRDGFHAEIRRAVQLFTIWRRAEMHRITVALLPAQILSQS